MKVWIVWLPNVGKSSLFNVLTKSYAADAQNFPFCTIEPNTWIVNVNDYRLEALQKAVNWVKIVPANVEFVDIAGIVEGASKWEWLGNKFLANIREADAILQVVRVFEDSNVHHVSGNVNPRRDAEIINAELILADLETLEKKIGENEKKAKSWDKEAKARQEIFARLKPHLESWNLAITLDLDEEEKLLLKDLYLLTFKPFIYACNVGETQMNLKESDLRNILWIIDTSIQVMPISVKMELDMMDFSPEDRKEYLEWYWITENPTDKLIKECYDALWLQYYFTAWEIEVRAWTIKKWWKAPQAAGRIHTDFEKKFIKADVVNWKDLVDNLGWAKAREHWKVKMEWKEYVVQDWDVMLFKFWG
ncbi:MAG: hypothetical protein ACD_3C00111G0007 [uncultured bacterium (gcode 4)]|uniref:OBG-type G domain-containing protein n=1 Tax=uncultured bacterium (gcode 4) TaxID=1234023 RepID=K2GX92_9BACT|nr:MAG: hypothetical protein ACD_3C00111G0007 [uncultured bacterium (gcode 4)]